MTEVDNNGTRGPVGAADTSLTAPWNKVVAAYYDDAWSDYRNWWMDRSGLSMHMGYWDDATRSHGESLVNMNRQMAMRVAMEPGKVVLDAGCGVGGPAIWLAETYGVQVVGTTLAATQAELGQRHARERGVEDRVRFSLMDYHATAIRDASIDIVWAEESLGHSPDRAQFFREAYRVLKPGGEVIVEDALRRSRNLRPADERLLRKGLLGWALPDVSTPEEYLSYAADAGFEDIQLSDVSPHLRRSSRRLFVVSSLAYPVALFRHYVLRKILHPTQPIPREDELFRGIRFRNIRSARIQWKVRKRDLGIMALIAARKPLAEPPASPAVER